MEWSCSFSVCLCLCLLPRNIPYPAMAKGRDISVASNSPHNVPLYYIHAHCTHLARIETPFDNTRQNKQQKIIAVFVFPGNKKCCIWHAAISVIQAPYPVNRINIDIVCFGGRWAMLMDAISLIAAHKINFLHPLYHDSLWVINTRMHAKNRLIIIMIQNIFTQLGLMLSSRSV